MNRMNHFSRFLLYMCKYIIKIHIYTVCIYILKPIYLMHHFLPLELEWYLLCSGSSPVLLLVEVSFLEEGKDEFKEEALLP